MVHLDDMNHGIGREQKGMWDILMPRNMLHRNKVFILKGSKHLKIVLGEDDSLNSVFSAALGLHGSFNYLAYQIIQEKKSW